MKLCFISQFFIFFFSAKYEYREFAQFPPSAPLSPPAPAPSSAHTTHPRVFASTASTASYTAPPNPPQQLPAQPPRFSGGVLDDMSSLKDSLPLQYQSTYSQGNHPMQMPATNGAMGANNYPVGATATSIGLNPYQLNQGRTNPFSPGQPRPFFAPSSMTSSFSGTPTMSSQPYGQQPFGVLQSSVPLVHQPATPAYFYPQSQTSMQIQSPSGQSSTSGSPSQLFPNSGAPTGQTEFLPRSHSSIPQQQYLPPSPQPIQSSSTSQSMYPSQVAPAQPQMGGHNVSGQSHGTPPTFAYLVFQPTEYLLKALVSSQPNRYRTIRGKPLNLQVGKH